MGKTILPLELGLRVRNSQALSLLVNSSSKSINIKIFIRNKRKMAKSAQSDSYENQEDLKTKWDLWKMWANSYLTSRMLISWDFSNDRLHCWFLSIRLDSGICIRERKRHTWELVFYVPRSKNEIKNFNSIILLLTKWNI